MILDSQMCFAKFEWLSSYGYGIKPYFIKYGFIKEQFMSHMNAGQPTNSGLDDKLGSKP